MGNAEQVRWCDASLTKVALVTANRISDSHVVVVKADSERVWCRQKQWMEPGVRSIAVISQDPVLGYGRVTNVP